MSAPSGGEKKLLANRRRRRSNDKRVCMSATLVVRDLTVSYGESKVLFNISVTVDARQVVACVGRNGAGKTTLLKTIAGFLKPISGSVMSNDTSLLGRAS